MAGVTNNTARQYNLKTINENGNRVTVRIAPGFNVVDDEHWKAFVNGKKVNAYVAKLKAEGSIDFGSKINDMELEQAPDTKSKSKSVPSPTKAKKAKKAKKVEESDEFDE